MRQRAGVGALIELDVVAVVSACVESLLPRPIIRLVCVRDHKATCLGLSAVEVALRHAWVSPECVANLGRPDEL